MCGSLRISAGERPKIGQSKNKFEVSGVFFSTEIRAVKNHENVLIHHVITTKKPSKNQHVFSNPFKKSRKSRKKSDRHPHLFFAK
jgi:hypothetical protein